MGPNRQLSLCQNKSTCNHMHVQQSLACVVLTVRGTWQGGKSAEDASKRCIVCVPKFANATVGPGVWEAALVVCSLNVLEARDECNDKDAIGCVHCSLHPSH